MSERSRPTPFSLVTIRHKLIHSMRIAADSFLCILESGDIDPGHLVAADGQRRTLLPDRDKPPADAIRSLHIIRCIHVPLRDNEGARKIGFCQGVLNERDLSIGKNVSI